MCLNHLQQTFTRTAVFLSFFLTPVALGADFFGSIEMGPTVTMEQEKLHTENSAKLGLKFEDFSLSYTQWIFTQQSDNLTFNPFLHDGFLKMRTIVWSNKAYKSQVAWEPQVVMPTHSVKRENGMIFAIRSPFEFQRSLVPGVRFIFSEMPIVHTFNQSSFSVDGKEFANPLFENRVDTGVVIGLSRMFSVGMMMKYYFTLKHDIESTDNRYSNHFALNPKLTFTPAKALSLALNFDTGNLMADDVLNDAVLDEKKNNSFVQLLMTVNF